MRLDDRPESDQVEDERGGGGFGGRHIVGGGLGLLVVAVVIGFLTGRNPLQIFQLLTSATTTSSSENAAPSSAEPGPAGGPAREPAATEDAGKKFVRVVLADTERTWSDIFREHGRRYELPRLVLFDDAISSGCGMASAAVGPFYCPEDSKVYLDLTFFRQLSERFGAPGDFARAYVIAHEIGHHVQNQLGIMGGGQGRRASIAIELQADCLAGVWGNRGDREGLLEPGDVEEGLRAAAAIGDDTLQRMTTGRVQPESWTHGSSADRVSWLKRGLESGDPEACRTTGAPLFR
jgi:predicted metalloprotease